MAPLFIFWLFALGSVGGMDYAVQKGAIDCVWDEGKTPRAEMCIMEGVIDSGVQATHNIDDWIRDAL